jgi:hypothetical protein
MQPWERDWSAKAEPGGGAMPWDRDWSRPAEEEKPKSRNLAAVANDTVIEAANAVAGGVKSVGDFIAPGNAVSRFIGDKIIRPGEESQSDLVKSEKRRLAEETQAADGMLGEVGAALGYVARNPLLATAQAAGSFAVPGGAIKAAGLLGGGTRAALAGGVLAGGALSGGDAAGEAYDLSLKAGASEEQAQAAARQASVAPAIVGGVTGMFGAERVFAGAKGFAGNAASRALKTGASEAAQEALEEGVTQFEAQRAVQPYDPSIDPMKGVAGAATLGAALGGITGAGASMLSNPALNTNTRADENKRDPVPDILAAPDIDSAINAAAKGVFDDLKVPDTEVSPEQAIMRMEAEAQRAAHLNVNDWSALGNAPAVEPEADWLREARATAEADQKEAADSARIRAEIMAPAPAARMLPELPGGRTFERDLAGITLDAEAARAQQQKAADLEQLPADAAAQDEQAAAVARAARLEGESPLAAALRRAQASTQPAAAAPTPEPAAPAAAAEPRIVERTPDMRPMSRAGAEAQAAKTGAEVVRIQNRSGKFAYTVLAPQQEQVRANDPAGDGAPGPADTGRSDGTVNVPEQRPADVREGADVPAETGVGSVRVAGVPRSDGERSADALTVGATFEQGGKTWTITERTERMVRARDAEGNKRTIATASKAWAQINAAAPATAAGMSESQGDTKPPVAAAPDAAAPAPQPQPAPSGETAAATVAAAPDDDFLSALFGTAAEQAAAQERFTAAEQAKKQNLWSVREAIQAQRWRAKAEHDDWSGRVYKANRNQVDLHGDGPSKQASMSIGAINEGRRRNAMDALAKESAELDKLADALSTDIGAERVMGNLRELMQKAEQAAASGNWPGMTAASLFESMLLEGMKFRGPGGKGNVTSNGLSKALLGALTKQAAPAAPPKSESTPTTRSAADAVSRKGGEDSGDAGPAPTLAERAAGRKVKMKVLVESTGQEATLKLDAGKTVGELDSRIEALRSLIACMKGRK